MKPELFRGKLYYFLIVVFFNSLIFAQNVNIEKYLNYIKNGNVKKARTALRMLKISNPGDPAVIYLDALLTENGKDALTKYRKVFTDFPDNKYADDALHKVFLYYYSLGYYKTAENYLQTLEKNYPNSPLIEKADFNIPDEITGAVEKTGTVKNENDRNAIKYTVQAGAFINKNNAVKLSNEFKNNGLSSGISKKNVGGIILNIVTVGKFSSKSDAEELIAILKKDYNINGRIKKVK